MVRPLRRLGDRAERRGEGTGDLGVAVPHGVLVEEGGGEEWTSRRITSLVVAPVAGAATGMRRGEALALGWRDVDLDAGRLQGRCSLGLVKAKGVGEQLVEGPTKTGRARVVDISSSRSPPSAPYLSTRGSLALELVRDSALVLGNLDGTNRTPSATPAGSSSRRCGAQDAGGGPAAEDPAARPAPHPGHPAAGRRPAGQGGP
jgi:hypothetical protein